jgi:uroporphyrinogen III methyltransferase/synthase
MRKGKVYLVGAGPGDPKLITVRGLEALRRSDAVVYDRLASPRLLDELKPGAQVIYVGKRPARHTMKQEEINRLLVDLALEGKTVTRLKGGDPNLFGRVGEEAELLVEYGIEFEIVPGVTSAIGVPAYAGIPVTHRNYSSSIAVITGHENPDKIDSHIHWETLGQAVDTIIFLMGVAKLGYIRDQLVHYGKPLSTPVALIRWGTRVEQKTLMGTLETIVDQVQKADFKPPAVIIVGEVVMLREKLAWYEKKPLFGKRILVTRARSQASGLADMIYELGGEALEFPVIETVGVNDQARVKAFEQAMRSLSDYRWVLFTSVNGVDFFFRKMRELRIDVRSMAGNRVAAVGPKTAEALLEKGIVCEELPSSFHAGGLLQLLLPRLSPGERVLLPRGDLAGKELPARLRNEGLNVTEIDVYETKMTANNADVLIDLLSRGKIHIITFTSSSTVKNLLHLLGDSGIENPAAFLQEIKIVCMGPVTAKTAEEAGLHVSRVAEEATIASMVETLIQI